MEKINFTDYPSTSTPINSTNLNLLQDNVEADILDLNTGWIAFPTTLVYSSADSPTGVMTTGTDTRAYLEQGMKLKYDQTHSLTAYWDLNANSNSQVGSFNGTDTAITYSAGKFSNCAVFNGTTSKIVIADATLLKPTGAFTIGMWFKTNTSATMKMFQTYSENTALAGIYIGIASEKLDVVIGNNTGTVAGTNYTNLSGTTNIKDNAWHYIIITYNNNYMQVYLDGKLETAGYSLTPSYSATNYVRVGCKDTNGTESQFFNGSIDDLFLINGYALSEEYIRAKYIAATAQGASAFTITKTAFISADPTATTITAYHGTDSMLINAPITNIYYSGIKKPLGFNINRGKWDLLYSNATRVTQSNPTQNAWVNINGARLTAPIGGFKMYWSAMMRASRASATGVDVLCTLSTANNTENDVDFTATSALDSATSTLTTQTTASKEKDLILKAKTQFYLNTKTSWPSVGETNNQYVIIKAICSYL